MDHYLREAHHTTAHPDPVLKNCGCNTSTFKPKKLYQVQLSEHDKEEWLSFKQQAMKTRKNPKMKCAVIKTCLKLSERSEIVVKEIYRDVYFFVSACAFI